MSSTAARLSLTSPTSAYLAVHFSNDRPHETSVATVRKNSRRFIASVLCFPCKDSASRTQNQIFRFCTERSPQGRRRPGKTDGGRAENSPRRRPPRLPPTGIYAGKDNLSRTISASFGPALPARRKKPERQNRSGRELFMLMAVGFRRVQPDGNGFYRLNPAIRPSPAVCSYLRLSAGRNLDYALAAGAVYSLAASLPRNTSIRLIFRGASRSTSALDAFSPLMKIT